MSSAKPKNNIIKIKDKTISAQRRAKVAKSAPSREVLDKKIDEELAAEEQDRADLRAKMQKKLASVVNRDTKININKSDLSVVAPEPKEEKKESQVIGITPPLNIYRKIAIVFIVLTIILLGTIFYFSVASVKIAVTPNKERISDSLIFDIYGEELDEMAETDIVGKIETISISETKEYNPTGVKVIGEEVTGSVTIINNYTKNQPLVATTRLLTPDNKLFRIKETVNVPAGGSIEVEVYADEDDPSMDVGATKMTIPGLWAGLQDQIYAETDGIKYQQKIERYIEETDIDMAVKDLKKVLLEKSKDEILESYQDYGQIIYDIDENSIKRNVSGKVGDILDSFNVELEVDVVVVAFNDEEVIDFAQAKLSESIPDDKNLVEFDKDETTYLLDSFDLDEEKASVKASFEGKIILNNKSSVIAREKFTGLKKNQIENYLLSLTEVGSVEIEFSPKWIKKAPNLVDRIEIDIVE